MPNCVDLIADMLWAIKRETQFTLRAINEDFKITGRSFDAEFRKVFLKTILDRVTKTYDSFKLELDIQHAEIIYESDEIESDSSELERQKNHRKNDKLVTPFPAQKRHRKRQCSSDIDDSSTLSSAKRIRFDDEQNVSYEIERDVLVEVDTINEYDNDDASVCDITDANVQIENQMLMDSDSNQNSLESTSESAVSLSIQNSSAASISDGILNSSKTVDGCRLEQTVEKRTAKNDNRRATEAAMSSNQVTNEAIEVTSNDTITIESDDEYIIEITDSDDDSETTSSVVNVAEKPPKPTTLKTKIGGLRRDSVRCNQLEKKTNRLNSKQTANECESFRNPSSAPATVLTPAVIKNANDRSTKLKSVHTELPSVSGMPNRSNNTKKLKEHQQKCMKKLYECYVCKYKTSELYWLNQHMNKKHFGHEPSVGDSTKKVDAPICSVINGKTVFKCNQCDYTSLVKRYVTKHIFIHKDKPFRCDKCRRSFVDKSHLDLHRNNHVNRCLKCRLVFTVEKLKEHQQICKAKRYECYVCKCKSPSLYGLIGHMEEHFGEKPKPFGCGICSAKFSDKWEMYRHSRAAHSVRSKN